MKLSSACHLYGSHPWNLSVGLEGIWVPSGANVKDVGVPAPGHWGICGDRAATHLPWESSKDFHKIQGECTNLKLGSVSNESWHPCP